ncbi:MAG: CHASE2 domain-containing protein [Elusimicrobia bacterium]|nr:CHASE2 domain-containing protein [Elusimicrobiota bacterium]
MTGAVKSRLKRKPAFWQVPLLLAAGIVFCTALDFSGVLEGFELKTLDWRLHVRDRAMEWLEHSPKPSDRIILVEINDESTAGLQEPFLLWDRYFAAVVNALTAAGPGLLG